GHGSRASPRIRGHPRFDTHHARHRATPDADDRPNPRAVQAAGGPPAFELTMTTGSDTVPIWDHGDFADFLRLERTGPTQFRNRFGDANARGRAFGGQLLAQALMATAATVP